MRGIIYIQLPSLPTHFHFMSVQVRSGLFHVKTFTFEATLGPSLYIK